MEIRSAFSPRERVQFSCKGPSLTKQSMAKECNVNFIVAKYQRTGVFDHVAAFGGRYGDFTATDFHEAMNIVAEASSMFEALPSTLRNRFENSPAKFLEFVQDEANIEEMYELGLAERPAAPVDVALPPGEAPAAVVSEEPANTG